MPNYNSARESAEHYLRSASDSELGSDLEQLNLALARVCASMAIADQMQRIADALAVIGDKAQDNRYRG